MHQREDEHHRQAIAAAVADMSPDSGGGGDGVRPPPMTKAAEDETNAHNASWLLDEMERLWSHDNVVDFHFGSWIASLLADACAPPMPSSSSSSPPLPRAGRIAVAGPGSLTAPPPLLAEELVQQGLRSLRERGKVFSTGDLPHARLKKLACQGTKLALDEAEQSPDAPSSPRRASDLAGDGLVEFEFKVKTLETIPSDSTLTWETNPSCAAPSGRAPATRPRRRRRRERRQLTKSLSELEFDELRGFRDLGFKLTEDNLTPRVVSLIPALSTSSSASPTRTAEAGSLTCSARTNSDPVAAAERIYPSHAWNIRPDSPLLNLRIPNPNREGVDMKAHLRFWARAVASTVRQEC